MPTTSGLDPGGRLCRNARALKLWRTFRPAGVNRRWKPRRPVPDRAIDCRDGHVGFEPLERAAPAGELAGSQHIWHAPDQAVAKRCTAARLFALDDDPTIEEWMVGREKPWPEVANFCASERTEIRFSDRTVAQLAWDKHGGAAFFRQCQVFRLLVPHARAVRTEAGLHLERDNAGEHQQGDAALNTTGFHKGSLGTWLSHLALD